MFYDSHISHEISTQPAMTHEVPCARPPVYIALNANPFSFVGSVGHCGLWPTYIRIPWRNPSELCMRSSNASEVICTTHMHRVTAISVTKPQWMSVSVMSPTSFRSEHIHPVS
jgi:hypothetical protein